MTDCQQCGTQMPEGLDTCPGCGAQTDARVTTPLTPPAPEVPTQGEASSSAAGELAETHAPPKAAGLGPATKKALIAAAVAVAVAIGLIAWQAKVGRSHPVKLSPEDMSAIVEGAFPPDVLAQAATNDASRKELAKDIREAFALGAEARRVGVADRPEMQTQLELARSFVIAQNYVQQQQKDGKAPGDLVTRQEVDDFLREPESERKFAKVLEAERAAGAQVPPPNAPAEQVEPIKKQWASVMVAARKGVAAGLDRERSVQLQIEFQEANVLSQALLKDIAPRFKPTEEEVGAALDKIRGRAAEARRRAQAGEDFTALVREYATVPAARQNGGDLGWISRGQTGVKAFDDAAFALQPGEVSDIVESPFGFHVIKVEERRTQAGAQGASEEQVHARHIFIAPGEPGSQRASGRGTLREKVEQMLQQEKQKKYLEDLVKRADVVVPDDFVVRVPEMPPGFEEPADGEPVEPGAGAPPQVTAPPPPTKPTPAATKPPGAKK